MNIPRHNHLDRPEVWQARVDLAERTAEQMRHEGGRDSPTLHLASIKRQLDATAPEYRQ